MKTSYKALLCALLIAMTATLQSCKDDKEPEFDDNRSFDGLVINEICGLQNPDDDWVELYNTSEETIDISGVDIIKTDETGASKVIHTISSGATIRAGEYYVIATLTGELTAGISNSKQVGITLGTPTGIAIDSFDRDSDIGQGIGHIAGGSYSRLPDGTGDWEVTTKATRGAENESSPASSGNEDSDYTKIVFNEVNGNDKYIELYNNDIVEVDIAGMTILKDDGSTPVWVAPEGKKIAAGKILLLLGNQTDPELGFTSGLSPKKSLKLELKAPDGTSVDVFKNLDSDSNEVWGATPKYNTEGGDQAMGRYPDGTGDWYIMTASSNTDNTEGTTKIEW